MTWVRTDDAMPLHPKVLRLSDGAFRLWSNGLHFANRATTDGRIDKALVPTLNHHGRWSPRQLAALVAELVPGLWVDCGDHFMIHDYEHHQAEALKERVERTREYERDRKRKQREDKDRKRSGVPASVPAGHLPESDRGPVRDTSVPSRPVPSRSTSPDGAVVRDAAAAPTTDPASPRPEPTAPTPPHPPPHVEAFERSLRGPTDATDAIVAAVSETRQAAGGAKFRPVSWQDREAVQKLAEWSAAPDIGLERLRAALVAFWAAKGTGGRLSWLVEEDPGRFLGAKPSKRGGSPEFRPCPPPESFALDAEGKARNRAELIAMGFTTEELEGFRDIA